MLGPILLLTYIGSDLTCTTSLKPIKIRKHGLLFSFLYKKNIFVRIFKVFYLSNLDQPRSVKTVRSEKNMTISLLAASGTITERSCVKVLENSHFSKRNFQRIILNNYAFQGNYFSAKYERVSFF